MLHYQDFNIIRVSPWFFEAHLCHMFQHTEKREFQLSYVILVQPFSRHQFNTCVVDHHNQISRRQLHMLYDIELIYCVP